MDLFKTVLSFANKQANIGYGVVALLTAGGEQLFSSVVFSCPCNDWNFYYGMVFLLVPALGLLVMGYTLSKKTWKLFTGLCLRKSTFCCLEILVAVGMTLFQISTTAVIAPASWIAVALLDGSYFKCAMTGFNVAAYKSHLCHNISQCEEELYKFPCGKGTVSPSDKDDVLATLRADSQILGWMLIVSMIVFNLLLTCVARCNSPISYLQLKFWVAYSQEENCLLESYYAKHAKELAERNLRSFFQLTPPDPIKTPSNKDWREVSSFYRFSTEEQYYSVIHQYVENRNGMMRGPCGNNPAVLGLMEGLF